MRQVCAWCRKDIGTVESSRYAADEVSHGICPDCVSNFTFQAGASLKEFLDSIKIPVFVVNDNVVVRSANKAACDALGKDPDVLQGRLGGEVFECVHARLPEGCGRTIHCSGCAIRKSVTHTFTTGESLSMVPAILDRSEADHPSTVALTITTVKVGDAVFLRVDRIG